MSFFYGIQRSIWLRLSKLFQLINGIVVLPQIWEEIHHGLAADHVLRRRLILQGMCVATEFSRDYAYRPSHLTHQIRLL